MTTQHGNGHSTDPSGSRPPSLGLLVLGDLGPSSLMTMVAEASHAGYRTCWFADERFFRDPWPSIVLAAESMPDMTFGTCVTDPFVRHIALTAREFATVSEITDHRVILGLGSGISGFAQLGIRSSKAVQALRESVEVLRPLLRGERVTYSGDVIHMDGVQLTTAPVNDARIVIATNGPRTMRVAADVADGLIVQGLASPVMVDNVANVIAQSARQPSIPLITRLDVCIAESGPAARERMLPSVIRHLKTHHPNYHSQRLAGLGVSAQLARAIAETPYSHDDLATDDIQRLLAPEFVTRMFAAGTPSEVRAQLAELIRSGIQEFIFRPVPFGGLDSLDMLNWAAQIFSEAAAETRAHARRQP